MNMRPECRRPQQEASEAGHVCLLNPKSRFDDAQKSLGVAQLHLGEEQGHQGAAQMSLGCAQMSLGYAQMNLGEPPGHWGDAQT